jgi:hypothetical protein
MSFKHLVAVACAGAIFAASTAGAAPLQQYASTVKAYSSQNGASRWSAAQVLGLPNTPRYGDYDTAWAAANQDGTMEFVSVGFGTAVYATGASIWETFGNGFVSQVDVIDTLGNLHTVWKGIDLSPARTPFEFVVSWEMTSFLVSGLKVHVNTSATTTWEEIDAIGLAGDTVAPPPPPARVPEPASLTLMGLGLGLFGFMRRRRA